MIMKHYSKLFVLFSLIAGIISCTDLTEIPYDTVTARPVSEQLGGRDPPVGDVLHRGRMPVQE